MANLMNEWFWYPGIENLLFLTHIPEYRAKQQGAYKWEKKPSAIVVWATPVCQVLFPKTTFYLIERRERI